MTRPVVRILGTRGVPAAHGGFETFAQRLSLHLAAAGWDVVVYCQVDGPGGIAEDEWNGVRRVLIPVGTGSASSVRFDWISTRHAASHGGVCLTLGYNTAVFGSLLRARHVPNVINMDGIEWARSKWGRVATAWFWCNERVACRLGDHLVADHPAIREHLGRRVRDERVSVIPYGADRVTDAPVEPIEALGLRPGRFLSVIARPEPENSIIEIVAGFSRRRRGVDLAVLGGYDEADEYQRRAMASASDEVRFLGPIYDAEVVSSLRFHSLAYVHGHRVGGTNPSLVEALGAGNAVLAHDNRFNRWVAGGSARYFTDADSLDVVLTDLLVDPSSLEAMRRGSTARFEEAFGWDGVLDAYEHLLREVADGRRR